METAETWLQHKGVDSAHPQIPIQTVRLIKIYFVSSCLPFFQGEATPPTKICLVNQGVNIVNIVVVVEISWLETEIGHPTSSRAIIQTKSVIHGIIFHGAPSGFS